MLEEILVLCFINFVLCIFVVIRAIVSTGEDLFTCPFDTEIRCTLRAKCTKCSVAKYNLLSSSKEENKNK